jgi:uncharacterized protein YndB with AHSA1/START domain
MTNPRTIVAEPGTQSIAFSREFEAPAAQVFEAHVDADLVAQWIGPKGTRLELREFDARTGGAWSYIVVGETGQWAFHGSFHEVTSPSRIVQTWQYDDEPLQPTLEVFTFVDLPEGRSRIDGLSVFLTTGYRDEVLGDFDTGRDDDFERLDELLAGTTVAAR